MKFRSSLIAITLLFILFIAWLGLPLYGGMEWMKGSPAFLLVCCFIVGLYHAQTDRRFVTYIAIVYLAGFGLSVIGANTGSLFGQHFYGHNLGVTLLDTPLIMGIYWLLLSYSTSVSISFLAKKIPALKRLIIKVVLSSLLMLIADILIEQVAAGIDFWYWKNQQAPVQNYTAWLAFAAAFNFLFQKLEIESDNKVAVWFFVFWICFLVALNLLPDQLFGQ